MQTGPGVIKIMKIITNSGKQEAPHFSSETIKHFPRDGSEHISRNKQQRQYDEYSAFLQVLMVMNSIYRYQILICWLFKHDMYSRNE